MKVRMFNAPDPLVKHYWTKGGEQSTDLAVYQTWRECQFKGADIVAVKANSLKECLEECDAELFCRHVTLIGKECMLKGWAPDYFEIVPGQTNMWAAKLVESKVKDQKYTVFQPGTPVDDKDLGDLRHDLLVGEHYDESTNYETKFHRYRIWEGFDFIGGDINTETLNLPAFTLDSCLEQCDHNPECAYAVAIVGKGCWLKSRPYQHSRMPDSRTDVYSAMKLGRVGKKGIDSNTKSRYDRRPQGAAPLFYMSPYLVQQQGSWTFTSPILYVVVGAALVWGFTQGITIWNRVHRGFYVAELS